VKLGNDGGIVLEGGCGDALEETVVGSLEGSHLVGDALL
jgi:hypothetical protein